MVFRTLKLGETSKRKEEKCSKDILIEYLFVYMLELYNIVVN